MEHATLHAGAERLGRGRCGACNILGQLAFEHLVGVDGASEPGCMRGAVGTHNVSGCRSRRIALCAQRLGDAHPPSPLQEWHEAGFSLSMLVFACTMDECLVLLVA